MLRKARRTRLELVFSSKLLASRDVQFERYGVDSGK